MFVIVLPANQLPQEYSCLRIQSLKGLVRILVRLYLLSVSILTPLTPSGPKGTREGSLFQISYSCLLAFILTVVVSWVFTTS